MADFADLFDPVSELEALGDDVTYIQQGAKPKAIKAFVDFDQQRIGGDGYTSVRQTEISVLKTDAPNLSRNDRFIHNGTAYEADAPIDDDGVYARWSVRVAS